MGKNTLAQAIANTIKSRFVAISAILAANPISGDHNERTILVVK